MVNHSYTDKQIEAANLLKSVGDNLSQEAADEIINMVGEAEKNPSIAPAEKDNTEAIIKLKLLEEKDWKKRAILSAMIISKSLE
jgi:hypothetical protein